MLNERIGRHDAAIFQQFDVRDEVTVARILACHGLEPLWIAASRPSANEGGALKAPLDEVDRLLLTNM